MITIVLVKDDQTYIASADNKKGLELACTELVESNDEIDIFDSIRLNMLLIHLANVDFEIEKRTILYV